MAEIVCISRSLYRHKGGSWYSCNVYSRPVVTYLDQFNIERRLIIRLEDGTAIPRFEQLRNLAQQLDLAPGTVARAYRELETDGLLEGRGRAGTFVVDEPPHSEPLRERRERIARLAVGFTFDARQVGATNDEALAAIAEALSIE